LVQSVGTCLLIVGLCFQIYSLNSNRWITWVTQDANEGLFYFEGLWNRCTIQQKAPVMQWACWNWKGLSISKDGSSPIYSPTPIRFYQGTPNPLPFSQSLKILNASDVKEVIEAISLPSLLLEPSGATIASVLGARILVITAIVLSAIGAIQVWLACKCCILIDENVKPCLLLATGALVCLSGVLSGIGVTWRAIQVLNESNFETPTKYKEKPNVTFGPGIWFGWVGMIVLLAGGIALALSSRLIQRRHYSLQIPSPHLSSRYTEYL